MVPLDLRLEVRRKEVRVSPLANSGVDDVLLCDLAQRLVERYLPSARSSLWLKRSSPIWLCEIDLGGNKIGDVGAKALLDSLVEQKAQLRVLKLHKNRIASAGSQAVANYVRWSSYPPQEVHLSHNYLGPSDARRLMVAAAHRAEYPLRGASPLWLRLEKQLCYDLWDGFERGEDKRWVRMQEWLAYAEEKLAELRRGLGLLPPGAGRGPLLCVVTGKSSCSPNRCYCQHEHGPVVHMPYMWQQGEPGRKYLSRELGREPPAQSPPRAGPRQGQWESRWWQRTTAEGWSAAEGPDDCWAKWAPREWPEEAGGSGPSREPRVAAPRHVGLQKVAPRVLFQSDNYTVLDKGPHWVCSYDSHGTKTYVQDSFRQNLAADRRSCEEIVSSGRFEFLDVYVARMFDDEMSKAWWQVHGSDQLEASRQAEAGSCGAGLLHRIDKETSGCLLRANNFKAFQVQLRWLRRGCLTKVYVCLVHGSFPHAESFVIDDKLTHDNWSHETFVDVANGEWAETTARCLAHLSDDNGTYSLCEVRIASGKTHQIRVHMSHRRYPLVADGKYNPMRVGRDHAWCPRMFLHHSHLSFWDDGQERTVAAPLPADLLGALDALRLDGDHSGGDVLQMLAEGRLGEGWGPRAQDGPAVDARAGQRDAPPTSAREREVAPPATRAPDELRQLREALAANVVDMLEAAPGRAEALATVAKDQNVVWKLRVLNCGGAGAADRAERLAAFAQEQPAVFEVEGATIRLLSTPRPPPFEPLDAMHEVGSQPPPPPPPPPPPRPPPPPPPLAP